MKNFGKKQMYKYLYGGRLNWFEMLMACYAMWRRSTKMKHNTSWTRQAHD